MTQYSGEVSGRWSALTNTEGKREYLKQLLLPQTSRNAQEVPLEKEERKKRSWLAAQEAGRRRARNRELAQDIWRSAQMRREVRARKFQAELRLGEVRKVARLQALRHSQEQTVARRLEELQTASSQLAATKMRLGRIAAENEGPSFSSTVFQNFIANFLPFSPFA